MPEMFPAIWNPNPAHGGNESGGNTGHNRMCRRPRGSDEPQFKLPHQCLSLHYTRIPHPPHTAQENSAQKKGNPEAGGRENVERGSVNPGHSREECKHQASWYKDVCPEGMQVPA